LARDWPGSSRSVGRWSYDWQLGWGITPERGGLVAQRGRAGIVRTVPVKQQLERVMTLGDVVDLAAELHKRHVAQCVR
jgi:hypothetical protein